MLKSPSEGSVPDIPAPLQAIIDDFSISEGREKIELLVDFSERMPTLPAWLAAQREQMEFVHECMTPVYVEAISTPGAGGSKELTFYFDVPAESPTVRGFAAIMAAGLDHATPEQVINLPADFYLAMGLHQVLTQQRLNGIGAILAHMKRLALRELSAPQ